MKSTARFFKFNDIGTSIFVKQKYSRWNKRFLENLVHATFHANIFSWYKVQNSGVAGSGFSRKVLKVFKSKLNSSFKDYMEKVFSTYSRIKALFQV